MKKFKNKNFAYGAATLLVGAMSFSSCSSNEEAIDPNPSYDGKSVKTQFAINIPHATQGTRMAGDKTQETGFEGMYDIKLLPMQALGSDGASFTSVLSLASITSKPTDPSWTGDKSFGKIYNDVNVPVGTSHFLFYAAGGASQPTSADDKFASGIIKSTISGSNTDGIKFELEKAKVDDTANEGTALLGVLNGVIAADGWKNYADNQDNELKELAQWFERVTSLKAGSANSVCRLLQSLYNAVDQLKTTGDDTEKGIASAIQTAVKKDDVFAVIEGTPTYVLDTKLEYPRNINMPDGSAVLSYNKETNTFSYNSDNNVLPGGNTKMDDICFPASIYYTVNTDLKATTTSDVTWPTSLNDWKTGFTDWGSKVEVSTRTIALTKPIQYSVAKLVTTVQCSSASLADSKGTMISVPANGFPVKGILIGGQPISSKWDFKPAGEATDWTNVIYDRAVPAGVAAKANTKSDPNYTLVMDNYDNKVTNDVKAKQQAVNIILELENTSSSDFYGIDEQIIPTGGHFYLLASLNPEDKTIENVNKPSVFMQDYKTTANVTIKSLKEAYNVIPDLRATNLKFGLAVDLDWTDGLEFDVIIGGDNNSN